MNMPEGLYILSDVIRLGAECEIVKVVRKRRYYTINQCRITFNEKVFICKLKFYNTGGASFINILTDKGKTPTEEENELLAALSSLAEKTREYPEDSILYKRNIARGKYFIIRLLLFILLLISILLVCLQGMIPYIFLIASIISALFLQREVWVPKFVGMDV